MGNTGSQVNIISSLYPKPLYKVLSDSNIHEIGSSVIPFRHVQSRSLRPNKSLSICAC